jgi:hypothetical protein
MVDKLIVGIKVLQYGIRIAVVASCEDNHLEVLGCVREALAEKWPYVYPGLNAPALRKPDV